MPVGDWMLWHVKRSKSNIHIYKHKLVMYYVSKVYVGVVSDLNDKRSNVTQIYHAVATCSTWARRLQRDEPPATACATQRNEMAAVFRLQQQHNTNVKLIEMRQQIKRTAAGWHKGKRGSGKAWSFSLTLCYQSSERVRICVCVWERESGNIARERRSVNSSSAI